MTNTLAYKVQTPLKRDKCLFLSSGSDVDSLLNSSPIVFGRSVFGPCFVKHF